MRAKLQYAVHAALWLLVIGAVAGCAGAGIGSDDSGEAKRTIKLGYLPITHAAPLYIEEEMSKEGFDSFDLELVKFGSWPDLMDALNTGNIDGASVLIELAMRAKEQGIDLKAVALGHKDGNVVVVDPSVNSPSDLKGKPFAIPHKYSTHNILLYQMLKEAGMAYEDVQVIELPPPEMPAALAERRIAGYVVAEPFGAKAVAIGKGKVLLQSHELWPDSVDCALVLRGELIDGEREIAQELVDQYLAAGARAEHKSEESKSILKNYMDVDDEVLDLSLQWIKYDELKLEREAYDMLREYLIEMGLSPNPPSFEAFVDNSLIEQADEG
ncbi:ABC transporter substrate-binding protein [Paenibacillus sp. IB182496]|uniref:ABC transporter substrate-binding protein n=1 Tax=Paenibacillus sabuli TaxID=2772509 RepID=A0A927BPD3_9BACL|nr:ABC transporter substrate-binding protein [Paenibacillus sabuli]MBD2844272.1 ABC transporter substrate-binding protein [Paenibacillus sabuli]